MIYQHYKGGLYYAIGYATRFSKDIPATSIEVIATAKHTETLQEVPVIMIYDADTGRKNYAFEDRNLDGVYSFYKDTKGNHWLRPREMFFEDVELENRLNGKKWIVPRFKRLKDEELFNVISHSLFSS
jgi:hypothetical protein